MWWQLLSAALWLALALSLALSAWGIAVRAWPALVLAAVLSGLFSFFAVFSIGPLTLLLTFVQTAAALAVGASASGWGWAVLVLLGAAAWVALVGQFLAHAWLG